MTLQPMKVAKFNPADVNAREAERRRKNRKQRSRRKVAHMKRIPLPTFTRPPGFLIARTLEPQK